jgi:predicted site-specific integrase-resolvase
MAHPKEKLSDARRAEGLSEFAHSIGISYDSALRAANDGRLKVIRFGKRILVTESEISRALREGLGS